MRALLLIFAALLAVAPAARAAPTCLDRQGGTIRCVTPGAMPVGWTPPPRILWERQLSRSPGPGLNEILKAIMVVGLLLALIALLPDFDSAKSWDRQEGDDEEKRS